MGPVMTHLTPLLAHLGPNTMPILARETELYPDGLLDLAEADALPEGNWWAMYTLSRREKQFQRLLLGLEVPFYCPTIRRRYRSPNGRLRETYQPLFSNYVFVYGDEDQRGAALTTGCLSKCVKVTEHERLVADLQQLRRLIETGEPLSPEARLVPGDRVRVKTGNFAGFEGTILKRKNETRLLVAVNFMQQGASVLLEDYQFEYLGPAEKIAHSKGTVEVEYTRI